MKNLILPAFLAVVFFCSFQDDPRSVKSTEKKDVKKVSSVVNNERVSVKQEKSDTSAAKTDDNSKKTVTDPRVQPKAN